MAAELLDYLVCYDIETVTGAGRARLQRMGKLCIRYGQRVQDSVFECRLGPRRLADLRRRVLREMDERVDSVRIYRLSGPRRSYLEILGIDFSYDMDGPLLFGSEELGTSASL